MLASHQSAEPGHRVALAHLGLRPLLDLEMRLGEGTGAALALTLLDGGAAHPAGDGDVRIGRRLALGQRNSRGSLMGFVVALEFLTRLRVRRTPIGDMHAVAAAQAWFPAIGLVIGAVLLGIDRLATRALPEVSVDVLLVVALAAMTGGLHLDGLADAADGLFGGRDREQRLAIMRDVHAGTYAIIAVAGVLALKWAGLAAMPREVRFEALLLVAVPGAMRDGRRRRRVSVRPR